MNVGVFLQPAHIIEGGGYTFQGDVFQSLVEVVSESHHRFTVFFHHQFGTEVEAIIPPGEFEMVSYTYPSLVERTLTRMRDEFTVVRRFWKQPGFLDRLVRDAGVDFVWFLSPGHAPVDTPYLTIVWDLQHRLQPWFPEVSSNRVWVTREAVYSTLLRRATGIIAGTEAGRRDIEFFFQVPAERIWLLPHPTPNFVLKAPATNGSTVTAKYGLPDSYLFYPAQFWPHKNHSNLLLAINQLREVHNLHFPVVFSGADYGNEAYVRQLAEDLGLSSMVYFLGFVPRQDLIALYRQAFALTYLTFFGPENLPPLEAFALGCPVVASSVAGSQEQLGDAAILVDPSNPEEISFAIKRLYEDGALRQTLVERGYNRANKFTGQDFVRGVFSILDHFESVRRCWDV